MAIDQARQKETERATSELLHSWYAAWSAHDPSAIAACLTEDAVLEEPGAPEGEYRSHDAILAWARSVFRAAPDFHLHLLDEWVTPGGDGIATYFKATGTLTGPFDPPGFAPTNGRIEFVGMDRNEIRDGKIARHQIFYDMNGIARQLGAAPQPGTIGERIVVGIQRLGARRLRNRAASGA
jgi:ketosteroid isomerase-like protein